MSGARIFGLRALGCVATVAMATGALAGCDTNPSPNAGSGGALAAPGAVNPHALPAPVQVALKSGYVRIANAVHPFAVPENDAGRLDPERRLENLSLFFKPSRDQKAQMDALLKAQLDPKSPEYHQWLTPESYAARFGAAAADVARATDWLKEQGLEVHRTSRLGTRVTFSGTVKSVEAAFQTEMHAYVVQGETHYAMATAPAIPRDLSDVVLALYNAHDFYAKPVSGKANMARVKDAKSPRFELSIDGAAPEGGVLNLDLLGPPDWANAYDVSKLYSPGIGGQKLDGTGVTIGIVGTADIAQSDIDAFRKNFNLPTTTITKTLVPDTGAAAGGRFGNGVEAILDVEWSGGIAKGATVNYVFVGSTDRNVDDATFYLIEENLTPIVSESYGGCEAGSLPTDADVLEENGTAANLMGITYMAAAGDDGADDCGGGPFGSGLYVDLPGAYPGVTSVGGTQFPNPAWTDAGALLAYPSVEAVWNESNDPYSNFGIGAGGGGISTVFARPDYQNQIKTCVPVGSLPVSENAAKFRQVPDVALSAASITPGYFIECTFGPTGDCSNTGGMPEGTPVGGTSAATPSFAGVVAILNQAVGERLGNINPLLYALEAKAPAAEPFHDITVGNNEVVCGQAAAGDAGGPGDAGWGDAGCGDNGLFGYQATTGYDCASGIGSIDGYNLVNALVGVAKTKTALTATPLLVAEGADVTLTATVTTTGTASAGISGDVTFTFESFTPQGGIDLSWELGTQPLTASGQTGTATLKTPIPPGLVKTGLQWVDVVAVYGGDTAHLTSQSPQVGVAFQPISFAVNPSTATMPPEGMKTFTTTGGIPPVKWYVDEDTTHGRSEAGFGAANIDEMSGMLQVGPKDGYVEIVAIDSDGAEAVAYITVGEPDAGAPWASDAGPFFEGGVPPLVDAGVDSGEAPDTGTVDSGTAPADSGTSVDAAPAKEESPSKSSGCSCAIVGGASGDAGALAAVAAWVLGAAFLVRRRRRA